MSALVAAYTSPGEAFWRYFELGSVRSLQYQRPILEVGCGDGGFTAMVFATVEDAIDINPRSIERARAQGSVYQSVRLMDARQLNFDAATYGTVYANCVLEHIPDLAQVLTGIRRALRPGGELVATVPLRTMNDYLVIRRKWYSDLRRRQLLHINLLTVGEWETLLVGAGFTNVDFAPYLYGSQCHFWDSIDTVASLGMGRYRLATAIRVLRKRALPGAFNRVLERRVARALLARARRPPAGRPCAVRIVAS